MYTAYIFAGDGTESVLSEIHAYENWAAISLVVRFSSFGGLIMKKIFAFTILLIVCLGFGGCDRHIDENMKKYDTEVVWMGHDIDSNVLSMDVEDGKAYFLSEKCLYIYDMSLKKTNTYRITGQSICVDTESVYIYDGGKIYRYTSNTLQLEDEYSVEELSVHTDSVVYRMVKKQDNIVIEVRFLNDEKYTESKLYVLNTKAAKIEDLTESFKGNDTYSLVKSINWKNDNEIVIVSVANTSWVNAIIKSYTYNLSKKSVMNEQIIDFPISDCAYSFSQNGYYYTTGDRKTIKKYSISEKSTQTIVSFNKEELGKSEYIDYFICEHENSFFYKNEEKLFGIVDLSEAEDRLTILTRKQIGGKVDIESLVEQYERKYGIPVTVIYYDESIFVDKVTTKLLAKDDDYDIIFMDEITKSGLISRILQYDLYRPLNDNGAVIENLKEMSEGIYNLLSDDGNIWCIPFSVNNSNLLLRADNYPSELNAQRIDWTLEDLWNLCEAIIEKESMDKVAVFNDPYIISRILMNFVQDQIGTNDINKQELQKILENIKKYGDCGVLYKYDENWKDMGKEVLFKYGPQYFDSFVLGLTSISYPENGVVNLPVQGKIHVELDGCAFVNKFSSNKLEYIYDFITLMTEEENLYSSGLNGIYKFVLLGRNIEKNNGYASWGDDQKKYFGVLEDIYKNAYVFTYDYHEFMDYFRDNLMLEFISGKIDTEQTADAIIEYIGYTYFE